MSSDENILWDYFYLRYIKIWNWVKEHSCTSDHTWNQFKQVRSDPLQ